MVRLRASPLAGDAFAAAGGVGADDFSCCISSILASLSTSSFLPGTSPASAPPSAISALEHTICHTVLLTAPLGARGNARNHPNGPNQLCSPGGSQNTAVLEYQLVTQNGITVVTTNSTPLRSMLNVVRLEARVELVRSRSARDLSTRRRSLAHFANWSWEEVADSCCLVV